MNKNPNAKSLKNLKPWPKGVSGNPSGRPKRKPISDEYAKVADMVIPEEIRRRLKIPVPKGTTFGQAVSLRIFMAAMTGKHNAAREIREAIEGRAPQRIELTGDDGGPVEVQETRPLRGIPAATLAKLIEMADKEQGGRTD